MPLRFFWTFIFLTVISIIDTPVPIRVYLVPVLYQLCFVAIFKFQMQFNAETHYHSGLLFLLGATWPWFNQGVLFHVDCDEIDPAGRSACKHAINIWLNHIHAGSFVNTIIDIIDGEVGQGEAKKWHNQMGSHGGVVESPQYHMLHQPWLGCIITFNSGSAYCNP